MKTLFRLLMVFLLTAQVALAQRTISGVVSDSDGIPLPGATVVIQGTSTGVTTDFDGNFSISADNGDVLVVSFVGYENSLVTVGSGSTYNFSLQSDNELEEVVVTALGLEVKKDEDVSSATLIKSEVIQRSGESGLIQGLAGKTSGVIVTSNTGDPGAGGYVQIRGQNTILGASTPLIIVDGVPISNATFGSSTAGVSESSRLNDIPASDIASVTVLKGAAATALWGSGAANGALVITTNQGNAGVGEMSIDFSASLSIDEVNREHPKQNLYGQGFGGNWNSNASGLSWGDKIADRSGGSDVYDTSGPYFVGDITGSTYYPVIEKNSKQTFNKENRDQIFRTGYTQNYSLGINFRANENSNTYLSYSRLDQEGVINGKSNYLRNTFRINQTTKLTPWLEARINASYIGSESERIQQSSNLNGLYLGYLRTSPDFNNTDHIGTYYSGPNDAVGTPLSHRSYRARHIGQAPAIYNNPGWTINELDNPAEVDRIILAPQVNITLADNITVTGRYGLDFYSDRREEYYPVKSAGSYTNGGFFKDDYEQRIENANIFVNGNFDLTDDINLNAIVGYVYENSEYYRFSSSTVGFLNPDPSKQLVGNAENPNIGASEYKSTNQKNSTYFNTTFTIAEDLIVDLAGRLENSTTVSDQVFYPSAQVGYILDNSQSGTLSFLKLRASYGEVGISPSLYLNRSTFGPSTAGSEGWGDYIDGANYGGTSRRSSVQGNPNLTVEKVTEYEFGADARFFDNSLTVGLTYYDRLTTDGILSLEAPPSTGFTSLYSNVAEISNKGIEFDFNYNLYNNADTAINIFGNYTAAENVVEKLPGVSAVYMGGFVASIVEGEDFNSFYGGYFEKDGNGNIVTDADGFPVIAAENGVTGSAQPDFRAGLGASITKGPWDFSFVFETSQGNEMWAGTYSVLHYFGIHPNTAVESVAPQDLPKYAGGFGGTVPAGTTFRGNIGDFGGGLVALEEGWYRTDGGGFGSQDELFIFDASFIKLREVSLSYDLPSSILTPIGAKGGSFGITGRNFLLQTDFPDIDPEISLVGAGKARGVEYFTNPNTESFLFNLKLNF